MFIRAKKKKKTKTLKYGSGSGNIWRSDGVKLSGVKSISCEIVMSKIDRRMKFIGEIIVSEIDRRNRCEVNRSTGKIDW